MWVDYSRGIAIILVVYRHAFEGLKSTAALAQNGVDVASGYFHLEAANILLYSFRMPLFFMVSGVFLSSSLAKRGLAALAGSKVRTILYPYFVWGFLQISIQMLFSGFTNGQKEWSSFLYLFYAPRNVEHFWYLLALFNVTLLYAFAKARLKWSHPTQLLTGALLFFLSAYISQHNIELGLLSDVLHYYIFMAIGDAAANFLRSQKIQQFMASPRNLLLMLLPFAGAQLYFLYSNVQHLAQAPKYLYVEYYQPHLFLGIALTGAVFVMMAASVLNWYQACTWLRLLGQHSLYIYVLHVIVFAAIRIFLIRVLHVYEVHTLLACCVAGGVVIPVFIYKLVQHSPLAYLFAWPEPAQPARTSPVIKSPTPAYEHTTP